MIQNGLKIVERIDRYNCMYLRFDQPEAFEKGEDKVVLGWVQSATEKAIQEKVKSIFLSVPANMANLLPPFVEDGFQFHVVTNRELMLQKTLIKSNIPSTATHLIGAIGIVISPKFDRLLLVRERQGKINEFWKPATGRVEQNEFFHEGATREVWEETGLKTKFMGLIGVRENKNELWGQTGMNMVCVLLAETEELQVDFEELEEARWFTADELRDLNYPFPWYKYMVGNFLYILEARSEEELAKKVNNFSVEFTFRNQPGKLHLTTGVGMPKL